MREKSLSDEVLSQAMNVIINSDVATRIDLARDLTRSVNRFLFLQPEIVEQLIAKLEEDIARSNRVTDNNPILAVLLTQAAPQALQNAARVIGTLKAMLDIRADFVAALKRRVPEDCWHYDWELE